MSNPLSNEEASKSFQTKSPRRGRRRYTLSPANFSESSDERYSGILVLKIFL
jgi:hypothetical protein